jgi:hypothetical protein
MLSSRKENQSLLEIRDRGMKIAKHPSKQLRVACEPVVPMNTTDKTP